MTMSAYLNTEYAGEVANLAGWFEFGQWAESLPLPRYEEVRGMWEDGWTEQIDDLRAQITQAVVDHPPAAPVREVVDALLVATAGHPVHDCVLIVSDGADS